MGMVPLNMERLSLETHLDCSVHIGIASPESRDRHGNTRQALSSDRCNPAQWRKSHRFRPRNKDLRAASENMGSFV
jgi:hypothetical protein